MTVQQIATCWCGEVVGIDGSGCLPDTHVTLHSPIGSRITACKDFTEYPTAFVKSPLLNLRQHMIKHTR